MVRFLLIGCLAGVWGILSPFFFIGGRGDRVAGREDRPDV